MVLNSLTYSYLLNKRIIVPPKVSHDKDSMFDGAYVKEVQVGKHDWVASFDLDSLYPHLIMQYNLSTETLIDPKNYTDEMRKILSQGVSIEKFLNKEIDTTNLVGATVTPNGQFFRTDVQGFLPKMLEEMYEDRKKYKKLMLQTQQEHQNETDETKKYELEKKIAKYNNIQLSKKLSLNSVYGALGSPYFRFYDLRLALSVTSAGQLSIRWIGNKINAYLNNILSTNKDYIIASDTDSCYIRLGELVDKVYGADGKIGLPPEKVIQFMDRVCEQSIKPYLDESFEELADYTHAYDQKMHMKREALSDKGIWTAKKRYILNVYNNEGVQYKEPKIKVSGLEMIKSSTPAAVKDMMKKSIEIVIRGTENDLHNYIKKAKEQFKTLPVEDISFPRGMNGLGKYSDINTLYKSGTPIHVKGAIHYNKFLRDNKLTKKYPLIQEGEKIKFTYLKMPNTLRDTVISYPGRLPPEMKLDNYIDYDLQFETAFLKPIKPILDCLGWHSEKVNTIEAFFS